MVPRPQGLRKTLGVEEGSCGWLGADRRLSTRTICCTLYRRGIIPKFRTELGEKTLLTYMYLAQIVIATTLIVLILLQSKGANLGGIFGSDSSVYRSRRGIEQTLYNVTVGLSVIFFALSLVAVMVAK